MGLYWSAFSYLLTSDNCQRDYRRVGTRQIPQCGKRTSRDLAIPDHIAVYGPDNHLRLTGLHETQAIDKFSYGLSIVALRSACRLPSSRTVTRAIWKINSVPKSVAISA